MIVDFEKMQSQLERQGAILEELYKIIANHNVIKHESSHGDDDKPMNIKEASEFLGIPVQTIYIKTEIPRTKKGKRIFFFKNELINYLKPNNQQKQRKSLKK